MEAFDWPKMFDMYVVPWALNAVLALVVFIVGRMLAQGIVRVVKKLLRHANVDAILVSFAGSVLRVMLLLVVVVAALNRLGLDTTSLVALIGAAGLAIGFAMQGSLQNLAAGVMIIVFRPFKIGDFVEAGGAAGVVEGIDIFATHLRSGDNKAVILPNGAIFGGNIVNYSTKATRRIDMVFGIGYDDDIALARKIITEILERDERVLKDPAPVVAVSELADSSVNLAVRPWCNTEDYWAVMSAVTEQVKLAFDQAGVSIPYPQLGVHMAAREAA